MSVAFKLVSIFCAMVKIGCCTASQTKAKKESCSSEHVALLQTQSKVKSIGRQLYIAAVDNASTEFSLCKVLGGADPSNTSIVFKTHHKTGTVMSRQAQDAIHQSLSKCGTTPGELLVYDEGYLPPDGVRFLHFERNPFELIVSAYVYHLSLSEDWLEAPIASEHTMRSWHGWNDLTEWKKSAKDGMSNIIRWAEAGTLPEILSKDSYTGYLRRVTPENGLLAVAMLLREMTLPNLLKMHDRALSQNPAWNLCLSQFYDDCLGTWRGAFLALGVPHDALEGIVEIAGASCPGVDLTSVNDHSSAARAARAKIRYPPLSDLMRQLRQIDTAYLNGTLAEFESHIGCPRNSKYV